MRNGYGLLVVFFTSVFLTMSALAETPQDMQRLLDQANAQAKAQFDKNYPQPKAPVINNRSAPVMGFAPVPAKPAAPVPVAPQWNQNQIQNQQPAAASAEDNAQQNKPTTPNNIYVPQNTADKSKNSQSSDSVFNIFK